MASSEGSQACDNPVVLLTSLGQDLLPEFPAGSTANSLPEDEAEDEADDIGSSNVDVVERGEGSSKTSDDLLDKERLMKKDCRVGRCDGFT